MNDYILVPPLYPQGHTISLNNSDNSPYSNFTISFIVNHIIPINDKETKGFVYLSSFNIHNTYPIQIELHKLNGTLQQI